MVAALLHSDSIEDRIQRRFMEQGQYDLCIDEGMQVTQLTSDAWPRIEAGMKMVMRIIIEQQESATHTAQYQCYFCHTWNETSHESGPVTRHSIDWLVHTSSG
jgi:hypothetical protein